MSNGESAPASVGGQSSRNLLLRVAAAAVLAPLAIAIAYAGGWLWTGPVTLVVVPMPSSPSVLSPQASTVPSDTSATM